MNVVADRAEVKEVTAQSFAPNATREAVIAVVVQDVCLLRAVRVIRMGVDGVGNMVKGPMLKAILLRDD